MNKDHGFCIDTAREKRLLSGLRQHPELFERFEAILNLTRAEDGKMLTADEVEDLLIEETRKLGNQTMQQWAIQAQAQRVQALKEERPRARIRKKNT